MKNTFLGRGGFLGLTLGMLAFFFYSITPAFAAISDDDYYGLQRLVQSPGKLTNSSNTPSGAFIHEFPIKTPPGRNGIEPNLKLQYNSQNTNKASLYGYGWDIPIPFIQRLNKYGVEKLYTSHYFTSSMSGDLEDISLTDGEHGTYGAKVDTGDFLKYNYSSVTDGWTVTDKRGTVYTFGTTTNTEQVDPANSAHTYRWYLKEIRDLNNNYISYEYSHDNGQVYPYKIKYTGNDITDGIFEVEFLKEVRDDDTVSYESGFAIKTLYRIYEIQIKISGAWVYKYELDYVAGDNTKRALLSTITETGKDESANTLTLPATSFTYQDHNNSWTEDTAWVLPADMDNLSVFVSDINADSLPDIIKSELVSGVHYYTIYINDGVDGFANDTANWTLPVPLSADGKPYAHTFLVDVNGDGYTDILKATGDSSEAVYINDGDGTGWTINSNYVIPFSLISGNSTDHSYRLMDVNGDGLIDAVKASILEGVIYDNVYINDGDGTGWTEDANWTVPVYFSNGGVRHDLRIFDVNGDNLPDIVQSVNNVNGHLDNVYLNNGTSTWVEDSNWTVPVDFDNNGSSQRQVAIMDVNNDGLMDIVHADAEEISRKVYLNKGDGTGWVQDAAYSVPVSIKSEDVRYFDTNGDGLIDFNTSDTSGGVFYDRVDVNDGDEVDLLSQITTSTGAIISPLYKASTAYKDGSNNLLSVLPFTFDTVYSITTNNGIGNTSIETLSYEAGKYYYGGERDRKFAGFNKVIATNGLGYVTKQYYHQGNTTDSANGEYLDDDSKIGQKYRTEILDNSSNKFGQSVYKWDKYDLGNGRDFVKLVQKIDFTYDGDADHRDTAESFTYENTYGNLTQHITWGEVTGSDDGTFTDTGADKFTTDYTYATNATDYVVGLPSEEDVIDQSSNKVKETRFYYDSQALNSVTDGNETKREFWKSGTTYIDTEKTYNSYGLVATETDARNKVTTYTYDANNLYPATVANPLSQNTTYTYDYSSGKVKTTTDPNTRVFETVYDAFDRPKEEKIPDIATPSTLVTKTAYTYTDNVVPSIVQTTNYLDGTVSFDVYTYIDGLGRKIQERKEAEDLQYSVRDFVYNEIGKIKKESLPYFSSGSARTTATTNNFLYTNFTYDPLQRIKTVINALGTTTNTYDQWETVTTDAKGINKDTHHDAYNRLVTVEEHNGANTYTTSYEYNGLNKLTKITDSASNVRNFTYDGLGRRLTAEDLHASADASFGTWTYVYDDAGNIAQTVDPKSQTVNYTYDDINRQLSEDYTGVANTEITYVYDTGTDGIGRLYTATVDAGPVTTFTYNSRGQIASETKNISSTNYVTSHEYDRQGNTTKIVYPDNAEVAYEYNTAGLLEKVSRKESGGSYSYIITDYDYAPTEKVTYKDFSNAIDTYLTYDPNKMYRLANLFTIDPPEDEALAGSLTAETEYYEPLILGPETGLPEVEEKRTANSKTYSVGVDEEGREIERMILYQNPIHYKNSLTNKFEPIDTRLVPVLDSWKMSKAPYSAAIKELFGNGFLTVGVPGLDLSFTLVKDATLPAKGVKADTGERKNRLIRYDNAVSDGIHVEIEAKNEAIAKDIVIESFESILDPGRESYVASFDVVANTAVSLESNGSVIREVGESFATDKITAIKAESGETLYIWPGIAEDANGSVTPITIEYTKTASGFLLTKKIPMAWLQKATYPVRTDATVSYYAGNGDGYIGYYRETTYSQATWDAVHDNSTGFNNYTSGTAAVGVMLKNMLSNSNRMYIDRAFLPFDTSALPDNAIITGATLKLYVDQNEDQINDADSYIVVVQTTQASTLELVNDDYDQAGSINNPTAGSSEVDISSLTTGAYRSFTLNSTGLGWISKTGWTKLGLREGHDAEDVFYDPGTGTEKNSRIEVRTRNYSGESNDPYIDITYTLPPTAATSLQTEGATNPIDVLDPTPEFSAIFNDPDTGDTATSYQIQVIASGGSFGSPLWDSAKTAFGTPVANGARSPEISYGGTALSMNAVKYYWRIKFWDSGDSAGDWTGGTDNFTVAGSPTNPTGHYTNCLSAQSGSTNPTGLKCGTPVFSAIYNDSDPNAISRKFRIQVNTQADFAGTMMWDSGSGGTSMADVNEGDRTWDIVYAGDPLTFATNTYYWRIKFWDHSNIEGDFSDVVSFGTYNSKVYQDNHYTYDANNNITKIVDSSDTDSSRTVNYTYDDLNRLTAATATNVASGTSTYSHTFTYDSLGNFTNKSDVGNYSYAGTGNANPHAATSINGVTNSYDNNGNLTGDGTRTITWNYRNLPATVLKNSITSTYQYDHGGKRISTSDGTTTRVYPNDLYNKAGTTTVKHVYANGELIATVDYNGTTTTVYHDHTDHLTGTGVITSSVPAEVQTLDYFAFGSVRINDKAGSFDEQKEYIGQYYDEETKLSYLHARYYDGARGQFLSQDPVHQLIGDSFRLEALSGKGQEYFLGDPQILNSYSYARNNPIVLSDPQGLCPACVGIAIAAVRGIIVGAAINTGAQYISDVSTNIGQQGLTPSSLLPRGDSLGAYGSGLIQSIPLGITGGIGSGLAKMARLSSLTGSSIGIGVGATLDSLRNDPSRNIGSALSDGLSTGLSGYAAGKLIGGVPGRDVKSITSPNFYVGKHMQNEIKIGITSQGIQSTAASFGSMNTGLKQGIGASQSKGGNNEKKK